MERHKITGLGLGLPRPGTSRPNKETSRQPHERSRSLHDPSYPHSRGSRDSAERNPRPHSTYSRDLSLHSTESVRAMTELDVAAAAVVGTAPVLGHADSVSRANGSRVSSHTTSPNDDPNESITHLNLARVRARSAPTTNVQDSLDPRASSNFPRADSLLRLDSNTTSKDLKKLLTTRVRHAPSSIDTNKANTGEISSSSSSPIKNEPRPSQLEPEKSRPRVEVYVVLNNHVAAEGGCFSGILTVRTRKPRRGEARHVRIDGGKVRIIGFEGVSETERYAFYQSSTPLSEASDDCAQLYESDSNSDEFRIAREGTFSLPFTMHVPHGDPSRSHKNAPKGIIQDNSVHAAIKYILLISFKVRDDADNTSRIDKHANLASVSIAHFYRNVELWPTYGPMALHSAEEANPALGQTGTVSSRTAQGLLFGGAGMLHLTAVLHRKVWLAGQKCMVYIGAWNETKKSIKTVTLAIIRKATIARPNQSTSSNRRQIAEVTLDAVRGPNFGPVTGKGWWAGIEPGATCEFSHTVDIPADALTVHRTHIIDISYALRVTLVTGSLSSNISVDLPFRIINAMSTDGLPVPPPPGLLIGGLKLPKEVPVSFTFNTSPKHATLDLQPWSSLGEGSSKTSGLQEREVLALAKHASNGSSEVGSGLPGFGGDASRFERTSQVSQEANTSNQLFDGLAPGDSMLRLMSELESDLNAEDHPPSHYSSQRSSVASTSILKPAFSTKHRVTFLTPKTANAHTMESATMQRDVKQSVLENQESSRYPKEPSSRRFALEDNGPVRAQPGQLVRRATDTWNDDDADEVLRSIRMDDRGFNSYSSSQGQELVLNSRVSGPVTSSSMSSDPWSASGSSYSQPSASYQSSSFETSPEQYSGPYPHSYSAKSISKSQVDLASKDETPRAGSVARFRPEIVTAPIRTSSSRATMVPTISSPMLAKSQSAHVVGSPANQYRRFSPQLVASAQLGEDRSKATSDVHVISEETRATGGQSATRAVAGERSAIVTSDSVRHSVLLPPSSSTLTVAPDTKAHLRSRSGPEPNSDRANNTSAAISDTPTKSSVRSRIAALEERSRSRPLSQYSNASSVNSIFLYK